jgi:hypothetical protein
MSHPAYSRSKFSKGKKSFLVGEVYSDVHFSYSFTHLNFKCLKLKQYDLTGDSFLPLAELI